MIHDDESTYSDRADEIVVDGSDRQRFLREYVDDCNYNTGRVHDRPGAYAAARYAQAAPNECRPARNTQIIAPLMVDFIVAPSGRKQPDR